MIMLYFVMSVITFIVYAFDKHAAKTGAWRVSESTLHLLELGCGWPGALLAQKIIRHKCRKTSYQIKFWLIVILNVAGVLYWN